MSNAVDESAMPGQDPDNPDKEILLDSTWYGRLLMNKLLSPSSLFNALILQG